MRNLVRRVLDDSRVKKALLFIMENEQNVIEFQKKIALIEAPTFQESLRAEEVLEMYKDYELEDIGIDELGNVSGVMRGTDNGVKDCAIAIEAHMDTVFPLGTVKAVTEKNGKLYCPGISDNARGIALIKGVLDAIRNGQLSFKKDIYFVCSVREEGIGGMEGLKYFLKEHSNIKKCLTIDGPDSNVVVSGGPGSRTLEIIIEGKGGHSWKHFKINGNPIHAAARIINKITEIEIPDMPRTTLEVTVFDSGDMTGVGAIPGKARMIVNYRSVSAAKLDYLEKAIKDAVEYGVREENNIVSDGKLEANFNLLIDVPPASQKQDSIMVSSMGELISQLGMTPIFDDLCPTNANISLGNGLEGICIGGGGSAGLNHSVDEWYNPENSFLGVQAAFGELVILAELS